MQVESLIRECVAMKFLFGGKGGVGKTTTAAAAALYFSGLARTLIVSTDPAHSLSDIFEMQIGGTETEIRQNLFALEIDPEAAIKSYKEKIVQQFGETLQEFHLNLESYLESIEHNPGAYESAIFDEFAKHLLRDDYETIVFDTAPTGSTLRLIFMPEYLNSWIKFLIQSRKGILKLREMLTREKDPVIETLYQMKDRFEKIGRLLTSEETKFMLVLNPETLAFEETARTLGLLYHYNVPVNGLVVNRVVDDSFPYKGYLKSQRNILKELQHKYEHIQQVQIPFLGDEVKGLDRLGRLLPFLEQLFH